MINHIKYYKDIYNETSIFDTLSTINFPPIMINNKTFIRNIIRNKNYD